MKLWHALKGPAAQRRDAVDLLALSSLVALLGLAVLP